MLLSQVVIGQKMEPGVPLNVSEETRYVLILRLSAQT